MKSEYQPKETRIQALGPLLNISPNSLKKILEESELYHKPMPYPEEDDWLSSNKELGQTYSQFINTRMNKTSSIRKKIYINPLQSMSDHFVNNCIIYCQNFFYPLEIKFKKFCDIKELNIESIINEDTNKIQYNASNINAKMAEYLPNDAHCLIV